MIKHSPPMYSMGRKSSNQYFENLLMFLGFHDLKNEPHRSIVGPGKYSPRHH